MKAIWNLTVADSIEIMKRAQANGVKPGESLEKELIKYMKEKGQKPAGHTELSTDEMIKEQASHGKKVLSIETNKDGKTIFKTIKDGEKDA